MPIAWVTGATGFWGRNVTLSLLRLGWQVVALSRSEPADLMAWATSRNQSCRWVAFDLNAPDWGALAALDTPQALFHCAVAWDTAIAPLLQPNVVTPIQLIETTLTRMQPTGYGRVGVFLGQNGRLGLPGLGHFSATQAALWTWAEAKSRDLLAHKSLTAATTSTITNLIPSSTLQHPTLNGSTLLPGFSLSLVFPPRAPSELQAQLAARLPKPPRMKPPPNADRLVRGVLQGKRRVGRRPWLAALATLTW
ncbi:MAG: NAD-dependent epimerase/dehydratase family protein [Cyanobacteria bacterium]|nr:NAD-dependent epimerase/dehydratase family protein [Cyanobacteriota bacterium]MDW8202115.1 NAD-dependent epimerase/dehydratase family protein [Cyanobacteriota bacterium SKYGB_h_bin112]